MRETLEELEGLPAARPKGNVTTVWSH
jgi:hypothetical protein